MATPTAGARDICHHTLPSNIILKYMVIIYSGCKNFRTISSPEENKSSLQSYNLERF
jgi:hypothetical protein